MPDIRILVVEDILVQSRVITRLLSPYGICDCAADGVEAVQAFQKSLEEKKPYQLICMDINMPNMDGQEALRNIRRLEKELGITSERRTRILMTTAQSDPASVMAALQGECDAYVIKPLNQDVVFQKLQQFGFVKKAPEEKKAAAEKTEKKTAAAPSKQDPPAKK